MARLERERVGDCVELDEEHDECGAIAQATRGTKDSAVDGTVGGGCGGQHAYATTKLRMRG